MRFLERALLACSMFLERSAKDRTRGRKRGRLKERKTDKEEEPVIVFLNTSCRLFFPKCVKMSNFLLSRETQKSRRHLVHAKLKPLRSQGCKPPGTVKCGGRRCQVCEHLTIGDSFESTKTKTNCNSSNVVYLLCCKVCRI